MKNSEHIMKILRAYTGSFFAGPRIGIFVDNKPCYIGGTKLYKSEGLAIRQIVKVSPIGTTKEDIQALVDSGEIELRKIE